MIFAIYQHYYCPILLILIILLYEFIKYPKHGFIIYVSIIFQFIIYIFVYSRTSGQKILTMMMIIFLFAWIQNEDSKDNEKIYMQITNMFVITILLVLQVYLGIAYSYVDISINFSSSYEVAEFIDESLPENSIMISNNMPLTTAIIPYTKDSIKYWNPYLEDYFTFVTWDENYVQSIDMDFVENIDKNFDENDNLYYIYSYTIPYESKTDEHNRVIEAEKNGYFTRVFESSPSYMAEDYIIYKINNK